MSHSGKQLLANCLGALFNPIFSRIRGRTLCCLFGHNPRSLCLLRQLGGNRFGANSRWRSEIAAPPVPRNSKLPQHFRDETLKSQTRFRTAVRGGILRGVCPGESRVSQILSTGWQLRYSFCDRKVTITGSRGSPVTILRPFSQHLFTARAVDCLCGDLPQDRLIL